MAVSGRFDLSDNEKYQWAWATYEEKNVNTSTNKSDLAVNVYFRRSNNGYTSSGTMSVSVTVNGTKKTASTQFSNSGTADSLVFSQTFTGIAHNTDGSKQVTVSVSASGNNGFNGSGSKAVNLTAIPRKAAVTGASNWNDEENPTIYFSNPAGFPLKASIETLNPKVIITQVSGIANTGVYKFNLTDSVRNTLRAKCTGNSMPVRMVIETNLGGGTYGWDWREVTFSVINANPTVTASVTDVNETTADLTGNSGTLIKYHSNAKAVMTAQAQKSATINAGKYVIRNGSIIANEAEHTFENAESGEFLFSAADSRGNTGAKNVTLPLVNYIRLTCNIAQNRPDALGNMSVACSGNFFNASFGAVSNTLTVQYRYAVTGGLFSEWADMQVTTTGNSYFASADFNIPDFSRDLAYSFETRAMDKLETVSSADTGVKATPLFHWSERDFVFEVPVTFKAGTEFIHISESGTDGIWTWRKWSDGTAECWGEINFPTVALDSLWDTFHYTSLTASLPSDLFIERPKYCNVTSAWDAIMFAVPQSKVNTSDTVKFAAVRLGTKTETFQNVPFAIHAIGRWK